MFQFLRVIERYPRDKRGVTPSLQTTTTTEEIYTYINKCLGLWCHCFIPQRFFGSFLDSSFSDSRTCSTDSWISSSTNSCVASAHETSTLLQNGRPHAAVKCEQPLASVLCRTVPHLIYSILDRFLWLHQNRSNIEHFHSRDWHLWNVIEKKNHLPKKNFKFHRTDLVHQRGRRFVLLEYQYGRRDVWRRDMRKPSTVLLWLWQLKLGRTFKGNTKWLKLWGIRLFIGAGNKWRERRKSETVPNFSVCVLFWSLFKRCVEY